MSQPMEIKADLVPYSEEYEQTVRSWIESEETYHLLCRGKEYPPPDNLVRNWQKEEVSSYLLFSERKPLAYGEIWKRSSDLGLEIAHVLVDPVKRGDGYGAKMVQLLINRAASYNNVAKVTAVLYDENPIALGCFMKAGFELSGTTGFTEGLKLIKIVI